MTSPPARLLKDLFNEFLVLNSFINLAVLKIVLAIGSRFHPEWDRRRRSYLTARFIVRQMRFLRVPSRLVQQEIIDTFTVEAHLYGGAPWSKVLPLIERQPLKSNRIGWARSAFFTYFIDGKYESAEKAVSLWQTEAQAAIQSREKNMQGFFARWGTDLEGDAMHTALKALHQERVNAWKGGPLPQPNSFKGKFECWKNAPQEAQSAQSLDQLHPDSRAASHKILRDIVPFAEYAQAQLASEILFWMRQQDLKTQNQARAQIKVDEKAPPVPTFPLNDTLARFAKMDGDQFSKKVAELIRTEGLLLDEAIARFTR
jgi:hypothetical protein